MAQHCQFCGKTPLTGRNVSHAHNVTSRKWHLNLKTVRAMVKGSVRRTRACTRCIRSGKVIKPSAQAREGLGGERGAVGGRAKPSAPKPDG